MHKRKIIKTSTDNSVFLGSVTAENDILLTNNLSHSRNFDVPSRIFMAFLSAFCTVKFADSFLETGIYTNVIAFYCFVSVLLTSFMKSKKKMMTLTGFVISALILVYLLLNTDSISKGFIVLADKYLRKANQPDSFFGTIISGMSQTETEQDIYEFFKAFTFVTGFFCTNSFMRKFRFPLLFVTTFPVFELALYWGWEGSEGCFVGIIICWIVCLGITIINHNPFKNQEKKTFDADTKSHTFYFISNKKKSEIFPSLTILILTVTSITFISVMIFSKSTGFVRPEKFNQYRKTISNGISDFTMTGIDDIFSGDSEKNLFGTKAVGGTNGGILGRTDGISFNGSTALEIETPEIRNQIYLKGYCAGNYADNCWTTIKSSDNDEYVSFFKSRDKWVQDLNFELIEFNAENQYDTEKIQSAENMNIKIKGASKRFAYAPYGTLYSSNKDFSPVDESYIVPKSTSYSVIFYNTDRITDSYSSSDFFTVYSAPESYTDFVKENYLKVTDSKAVEDAYKEILKEYLMTDENNVREKFSTSEICLAIQKYFSDNFRYTLTPGKTPSGKDFIDYFLSEQKEGYCTYFSSAGVMLLRKFGIPARYVEGYTFLPSQLDKNNKNGDLYKVSLTDNTAHSWAEIYTKTNGWIPVEFTPGYDNSNPNITDTTQVTDSSATESYVTEEDKSTSSDNDKSEMDTSFTETTTSSTSVNSVSGSEKETTSENSDMKILWLIAFTVFVIVVYARRKYRIHIMKREISTGIYGKRIKEIYRYALRYISLLGISTTENITDLQLCRKIIKECNEKGLIFPEDDFIWLCETAVKSQMSCEMIHKNEYEKAVRILTEISDKLVRNNISKIKLIYAVIVECLY